MIPEIGHFLLWLALGVALLMGVMPLVGAHKGRADWMAVGQGASLLLFVLVLGSFLCLTMSFVQHDFSVKYVAGHSNSQLPLMLRIAAVWGGHEGSMLLWLLMQSGWALAVATFSQRLPRPALARILAVLGWLTVGFLLFTLITSNPFERLLQPPADGRDLNPLLQDPGMIFHPPMLYMGYVGFSVAFAFAVAALISGQLDATWARWTRPWTTAAWVFLTLGIALGSWWAYYELGWGGWWFWDPVENASFMPWLVGTALIHSLAVTEKRGAFKSWTLLLAIAAFSLSLLGTFLVRSGVLSSVHAFATDPRRGLFILGFLTIVIGASLVLYAWRAPKVGLGARFEAVSRESFLLANNLLLVVAMLAVMLGTLYPLLLDALGMGKISVGPPYFDAVFVPLMVPLVVLMAVGPLARWKHAALPDLGQRLRWAAAACAVATLLTAWQQDSITWRAVLGLAMAYWVLAGVATDVWERVRPTGVIAQSVWARCKQVQPAAWGMSLAHLGVAAFIFGVTMVNSFEVERDVKMDKGDTVQAGGYTFTFQGVTRVEGPNYDAAQGLVVVTKDGLEVAQLKPEKRVYRVQSNPMTEAAIRTTLSGDQYVSLGQPAGDTAWVVRVYHKPFVGWIWGGCVLMALGGVLALSDRRYRVARRSQANETSATVAA
jgi:cytochrome c-type biogenesis protein CcmF